MAEPIRDPMSRRLLAALWVSASLLFSTVVAVALSKAWPRLFPPVTRVVAPDPTCDLRAAPCRVRLPAGGWVGLGIEPVGIPLVTPLRLQVEISGLTPGEVAVDFAGVDMDMGYNRVTLSKVGPHRYEGQGMLPVCARARMTWEARVLIRDPDGLLAVPFHFQTHR